MKNLIYRRTLLVVIPMVILTAIAVKWVRATDPHLALGEWENAQEWRKQGKCLECHGDAEKFTMRPPDYHTVQFRLYTHGRTPALAPSRCYGCHDLDTCQTCHQQRPASHTEGFVQPTNSSAEGLIRHQLLGQLRPSSCRVCHQSFVRVCTPCHTSAELTEWDQRALNELVPWRNLLYAHP